MSKMSVGLFVNAMKSEDISDLFMNETLYERAIFGTLYTGATFVNFMKIIAN
jgi:hypothetical protein